MRAETWWSGITCRFSGTLSIIWSEASVFFVTLISIDRFLNIKYPFSRKKLRTKSTAMVVFFLWITSLALGIVPSSLAGKYDSFYDNSHVCIGLPLTKLKVYETHESENCIRICSKDNCYYTKPVESRFLGEVNGMVLPINSSAVFPNREI